MRGVEGVEVERATHTSKGSLGIEFNGRFVRSEGVAAAKSEEVMV